MHSGQIIFSNFHRLLNRDAKYSNSSHLNYNSIDETMFYLPYKRKGREPGGLWVSAKNKGDEKETFRRQLVI